MDTELERDIATVSRFVKANHKQAGKAARQRSAWIVKNRSGKNAPAPKIYMYWGQGFANAHPVVAACRKSAERFDGNHLVLLDEASYPYYVDIEDDVVKSIGQHRAMFADLLRVELLSKFGGIWQDATCLSTAPLMDHYEAMVGPSGFFAFGKDSPGIISNWFLASRPGDYVMCYMREMLLLYWREFDRPLQYHFFHQILKESYFLDNDIEKVMSNMPDLGWEPRAANRKMAKAFEPQQFAQMKQRSPVHKLSHKVKKSASHSKTTIAAVVRGEAS